MGGRERGALPTWLLDWLPRGGGGVVDEPTLNRASHPPIRSPVETRAAHALGRGRQCTGGAMPGHTTVPRIFSSCIGKMLLQDRDRKLQVHQWSHTLRPTALDEAQCLQPSRLPLAELPSCSWVSAGAKHLDRSSSVSSSSWVPSVESTPRIVKANGKDETDLGNISVSPVVSRIPDGNELCCFISLRSMD